MKKLLSCLVFTGVVYAGLSQPKMQATIKQGNAPLSVDVYIRPSQSFSNMDENVIIVLALPATIKPAPSLGASGTAVNSLGPVKNISGLQPVFLYNNLGTPMRDIDVTRQAINGDLYFLYTIVFGGTAQGKHTWQTGVEEKACTIQFTGCTSNCNPGSVLLVNLPDGGARHNSYWYFQANTISDITNYKDPFYANDQTGPAVNGGSPDGSALSYLSLKLSPPPALPAFKASAEGCDVKINWEAPAGADAAYYAIERSDNNVDYTPIYKVNASSNPTMTVSYNTMDKTVLPGTSFYRLSMAGINGKLTYSLPNEVQVNCAEKAVAVVSPTLGHGIVNVLLARGLEDAQVRGINSFGIVVASDKSRDRSRMLNLTNSGKGAYIIQIVKEGKVLKNVKVIVL